MEERLRGEDVSFDECPLLSAASRSQRFCNALEVKERLRGEDISFD